jgi:hypothetical protein
MTSSARVNSSVILATNAQVVSGRRPRAIATEDYLKFGRVSFDGGYRAHFVDASLSLRQSFFDVRPGNDLGNT